MKIPDATTVIRINNTTQMNKIWRKKMEMLIRKIPEVSGLLAMTAYNAKIKGVDSKVRDLSGLVKKTDYDAKILEIERKYFTTYDCNKFTGDPLMQRQNKN